MWNINVSSMILSCQTANHSIMSCHFFNTRWLQFLFREMVFNGCSASRGLGLVGWNAEYFGKAQLWNEGEEEDWSGNSRKWMYRTLLSREMSLEKLLFVGFREKVVISGSFLALSPVQRPQSEMAPPWGDGHGEFWEAMLPSRSDVLSLPLELSGRTSSSSLITLTGGKNSWH